MATDISNLLGGFVDGSYVNTSKPITNGKFKFVYFQEDSTVSVFTSTGLSNTNELTLWNLSTTDVIKAGTILFSHNGLGIKALTLTSGSAFVFDSVIA